MIIPLLVAGAVAVLVGFVRPDYPDLPYWWRWDPAPVVMVLFVTYGLYAIIGVGAAAVAEHFGLRPLATGAGRDWGNGVVYGLAAGLLLRIESTTFGLIDLSPARLLLKRLLDLCKQWLDVGTHRTVARKIGDLSAQRLCEVSIRLFVKHVEPQVDKDVAEMHRAWLNDQCLHATKDEYSMEAAGLDSALGAREQLRNYIENLIVTEKDATISLEWGSDKAEGEEDVPRQA
jgi:hypothetical protein